MVKKISLIAACVLLCVGIVIPIAYMSHTTPPVIIDNSKSDSCTSEVESEIVSNPDESEPVVSEPIESQPDEVSIPEDENVIGVLALPLEIGNENNIPIDRVDYDLYQELEKYDNNQLLRILIRFYDDDIISSVKYNGYDLSQIKDEVDKTYSQYKKISEMLSNEQNYTKDFEEQMLQLNEEMIALNQIKYEIIQEIIKKYSSYLTSIEFKDVEEFNGFFIVTTSKEKIISLCKNDERFYAWALGTNKRPDGYDEIIPTSLANLIEAADDDDLIEIAYSPIGFNYDLKGINYKYNIEMRESIYKYCNQNNLYIIHGTNLKTLFYDNAEKFSSIGLEDMFLVHSFMTKQQIYDLISQGVSFITDCSNEINYK